MRLHRLEVTAFGPFAATEVVDFDELNDAGLFLLTGATGAGKSSVLDAVCFALYGSVPGVRGVKTLKSQHAPPQVAPEVVLDFTVRERRFVVRRSPEWSRPKKRGDGVLTEKASASILETTGGVETFHSSRAAEVGLLVNDLMGMTASQFVQVALLPQGEFQVFLRASSQERHDVLQRLFRTDRFGRIEQWVHEHSRDLNQRAAGDQALVQRLVDAVAERGGTETPDELRGAALPQSAADGRALWWARSCVEDARTALDQASHEHHAAVEARATATLAHQDALRAHAVAARRTEANAVLRSLADTEAEAAAGRAALQASARGERCLPLLAVLDEARAAVDTAEISRRRSLSRVATDLPAVEDPDATSQDGHEAGPGAAEELARLLDETRTQATRLETLVPREAAAEAAIRERAEQRARLQSAESEVASLTTLTESLPVRIAALDRRVQETTARAARREAIRLSLEAASRRRGAVAGLADADAAVTRVADEHRDARDRALTARERNQDLAARRLAGMAAELASRLADGEACEVCGSTQHPLPAQPGADHVSEAEQDAAEQDVLEATEALELCTRALQEAEHRRNALATAAEGRTPDQAEAEVAEMGESLAHAEAAASELPALNSELDALASDSESVAARHAAAVARAADLRTAVAVLDQTVSDVAREIAEMTGSTAPGPLRPLVDGLRRRAAALEEAARAVDAADRAALRVQELLEQAERAVAEHGFDSVDAVRSVLLEPDEHRRISELLAERDEVTARARAVLDDLPEPEEPARPVAQLAAALAEADARAALAGRQLHSAEERWDALRSLLTRLEAALTAWAPLRDEALRAEGMSRLVRGIGHDNQLQMRLSAYVLATRLDQVVAAANERLGHLRDHRYLLQRTDRAARKGTQAGLGLEVVDQWTGDARSPATLSGGETFVVSLSLALGLADVVTQEAGGTEIDTLFVDEGFGTLDADTLDDVMDRLDGLRAGGRTVGVVSHVSELRNRIPTQVHVHKGRSGSSIAIGTMAG